MTSLSVEKLIIYFYDPEELEDIDEIIDNHPNTEKKIEKFEKHYTFLKVSIQKMRFFNQSVTQLDL